MAFRMQTSVPELTDFSQETKHVLESCTVPMSTLQGRLPPVACWLGGWQNVACSASNCSTVAGTNTTTCHATSAISVATSTSQRERLIEDLKQRDMLKDTLIVWGGEFGRTVYCQGKLARDNYGRDHHPRCFTMWMAGGGIQGGRSIGLTDDFSYNVVEDPVKAVDINNTILHCLGIDNSRLSVKFQGLDARITGVEDYRVLKELLS